MLKDLKAIFSKLPVVFVVGFLMMGASCNPPQRGEPLRVSDEKDVMRPAAESIDADVFLDATLSMQGFITDGSLSHFQQTIPILERAVIKNNGRVHFFKFGTVIKELPNRAYSEFDKKSFYADSELNTTTLIEKVIDKADLSHLTIVVTDLFQEKADINQLSDLMKKKIIANDLGIGILAIKSQFDGKIYDVGTNNRSFAYASGEDPASFRPFYLIAFGQHADINKYFDTLVNGEMAGFPVKERIIFSRFLVQKPSNFEGSKVTEAKGLNEVGGVLVTTDGKDKSFKEFKVKENVDAGTFTADLQMHPVGSIVGFGDQLGSEVQAYVCNDPKGKSNAPAATCFLPDQGVQGAVTVQANLVENTENKKIRLKLEIQKKPLAPRSVYCFRIILRPKEHSLPNWIGEWNMTGEQVEAWHRNPGAFEGSKTSNLLPFLQTLWETTRQSHNPKVADIYCYFKRD